MITLNEGGMLWCLTLLRNKVRLLVASQRLTPKAPARLLLLEGIDRPKTKCNA
jgi:hypothetical protein